MGHFKKILFLDTEVLAYIKPYIRTVLLAIVFSLLASGATAALAWLVKPAIDNIFVEKNYGLLKWLPAGVIGVYLLQSICTMIYNYLMRSAGFRMVRDTRMAMHDHLLYLPVLSVSKESSGKMISRILNDSTQLRRLVTDILLVGLKEIPTIILLFGVAMYRRWDLTLMALIVLPAIIGFAHRQGKRVKKKRNKAQVLLAQLSHYINEATGGAKVIKAFTNEKGLAERFNSESIRNCDEELKIVLHKEYAKFFANLSTGIGVAIVIWYGGNLVVTEVITVGDFFSALGAIVLIFTPIKQLSKSYTIYQEIKAASDRIKWVRDMELEDPGTIPLPAFTDEIQYDHISHRYAKDGELVLHDVNLSIKKGEVVAIVGPSGAGKTTLIDLLPRFYSPASGAIRIDGHDLSTVKVHDLRKLIGVVSQDVMLFNDTIRANIAFGTDDGAQGVEEAARLAHAHEFISVMEDGYDTLLGERGVNLSGGQRQRVAIARAIYKNPPILILDEATSALDSVSETLVQDALDILMKEKTTIVVAHRLSTIINADRILVMDNGRIINQGTHSELMGESDVYQELYQSFASSHTNGSSPS
ncbi:MAG: ABC transporter transmembrane domain-containing protein [Desulfobulbaceae bacterium]|jgi:subfamily B ATP-binding cassette protein MsbA|nr:ABC transporter transmembrane domain-containing protein [Desulfobulbaceae bacterium]